MCILWTIEFGPIFYQRPWSISYMSHRMGAFLIAVHILSDTGMPLTITLFATELHVWVEETIITKPFQQNTHFSTYQQTCVHVECSLVSVRLLMSP